jgi:hypothetical protein
MKRDKVLTYFKQYDCEVFREGKNHTVVVNRKNNKITAVPRHPDVKDKLVLSMCKDLDIPQIQSH